MASQNGHTLIYSVDTFDFSIIEKTPLQKRKRGNPASRKAISYKNAVCAFDIETTRLADIEQSIMYIWQFQFNEYTLIGRTWEEFNKLCENIKACLNENEYLLIWVHNLSYEFQFLTGIYKFKTEEVFATDSRKVCKCSMFDCLEFRCSYHLTNMSLDRFIKSMDIENKKLHGFDYSKIRFADTPLTEEELQYCINDVKGLVQAITKKLDLDNDNFYTIPLTATGYIRRIARRELKAYSVKALPEQLPEYKVFKLLRMAFRGGNTHANRYYVGAILENENKVNSYDRSSSYPDVMINKEFPVAKWREFKNYDFDYVIDKIVNWETPAVMLVRFWNIRLRDILDGFPYIPKSKCTLYKEFENDNGRCLSAEFIEIAITDIDFKIILKQYDFDDCEIVEGYYNRYGKLPYKLTNLIKKLYTDKTELKGVEGMEYEYAQAKALLNSVYGMTVQSPVKQSILYDDLDGWRLDDKSEEELLEKAYKRAFLSYAVGVWTTCHARAELQEMIDICGHDCVYTDTDSVKFVNKHDFTAYNEAKKANSIKNGAFAVDPSGITHYMGVAEFEGNYDKFVTWGAKKYAYEKDGHIGVTIAGVNKKLGGLELEKRGGLEALQEGFTFFDAGGTEAVYNDENLEQIDYHGRQLLITANIVIRESTYTLGLTDEYIRIIEHAQNKRD